MHPSVAAECWHHSSSVCEPPHQSVRDIRDACEKRNNNEQAVHPRSHAANVGDYEAPNMFPGCYHRVPVCFTVTVTRCADGRDIDRKKSWKDTDTHRSRLSVIEAEMLHVVLELCEKKKKKKNQQ